MIGDHHLNIAPLIPFPTQSRDAFLAEQRFCSGAAEHANRFRTNRLQLAVQKLAADFHFIGLRCSILGRAALHHVADVNIGALDRDAFLSRRAFDHLREQLSRTADEWQALGVFIGARAFTDEHEPRLFAARSEYDLVATFVQAAALAIADVGEDG